MYLITTILCDRNGPEFVMSDWKQQTTLFTPHFFTSFWEEGMTTPWFTPSNTR